MAKPFVPKIEKGIPVPIKWNALPIWPWHAMKKGDSFFVPLTEQKHGGQRGTSQNLQSRILASARLHLGEKFITSRCVTENGIPGIRVWRIK